MKKSKQRDANRKVNVNTLHQIQAFCGNEKFAEQENIFLWQLRLLAIDQN